MQTDFIHAFVQLNEEQMKPKMDI